MQATTHTFYPLLTMKRIIIRIFQGLLLLISLLTGTYFLEPKSAPPQYLKGKVNFPVSNKNDKISQNTEGVSLLLSQNKSTLFYENQHHNLRPRRRTH